MISQSETKHQFLHVRKRKCHDLTVVTVPAAAHSTSVQLCTAVTFHYSASCCPQYKCAVVYSSHVSLECQLLPTVQACSSVQQSRFGAALPVLSKVQPEGGPATARLANRLQCSSAVSSRLSDSSQPGRTGGQAKLLTDSREVLVYCRHIFH